MNRLKIIFNLLFGKDIIIYNVWTKEVLCVIGHDEEIMTNRYDYDFISDNDNYIKLENNKLLYEKEEIF